MANTLDKLTLVELRDQWQDEARDFTPWLAESANLSLLAETLGINLDSEDLQTEVAVGPYRADIVVTTNEGKVVIENQLDSTDHSHLGQALTYAAVLNANTVIWIARRFTEEHRQAVDWLNALAGSSLRASAV